MIAVGAVVLLLGVILVLLLLRGSVGGDDPAPSEADRDAQGEDSDTGERERDSGSSDLVADGERSTARVPLPLEVEDGMEAVTVRAAFVRGAAALPTAGDRVVLYRLDEAPENEDAEDEAVGAAPDRDAQRLLEDVEVLGVIGPRPAANDGSLTFVLAVDEADVPGLLPLARDGHLWLTLSSATGAENDDVESDDAGDGA